jgi:hypothetical protein
MQAVSAGTSVTMAMALPSASSCDGLDDRQDAKNGEATSNELHTKRKEIFIGNLQTERSVRTSAHTPPSLTFSHITNAQRLSISLTPKGTDGDVANA